MSHELLQHFMDRRILPATLKEDLVPSLQSQSEACELVEDDRLVLHNSYLKDGLVGSLPKMFARQSVAVRLRTALEILGPDYGLVIYDSFRSTACQRDIFNKIYNQLMAANPDQSAEWVSQETRKYVVHPDETSRYPVAPHNSGGAIDLTLSFKGQPCDMGGEFDDPTDISTTNFFEKPCPADSGISPERWEHVRRNRRILHNVMIHLGFTNYAAEWWHYDLGDCMWSQQVGVPWFYASMEEDVRQLCTAYIQ